MPNLESLATRWNEVAARIAALGPMRPGTVCQQKVKYRAKDGTEKSNGPYPILTFKNEGNKTRTIRLRSSEETEIVERQIVNFREFRELTRELVRVGREMADLEMAAKNEGKKNSSSASKTNRKGKRRRSWIA
jgi:hypothetical protein